MNPPNRSNPYIRVERHHTTADDLIRELEARGLGLDISHTGTPAGFRAVRIWQWPFVIGRYRPTSAEPVAKMLAEAMKDIEWSKYPELKETTK